MMVSSEAAGAAVGAGAGAGAGAAAGGGAAGGGEVVVVVSVVWDFEEDSESLPHAAARSKDSVATATIANPMKFARFMRMSPPRLCMLIPAFAGMTVRDAGLTEGFTRLTVGSPLLNR